MIKSNQHSGFTIIEVVLVLAIAGMLFLVVFLAGPARQRNQRDNARKQDVNKVVGGIQRYIVDNSGWPVSGIVSTGFFTDFAIASGAQFRAAAAGCTKDVVGTYVQIAPGCNCSYTGTLDYSARTAAIHILLENGGAYCKTTTR